VAVPLLATRRWLCTIGAVGQPRDGNPAAAYALLDEERETLTSVRIAYDIESAAQKIIAAGLPPRFAARLHLGR
jgi:diadenosine tetraphosphatase ApaH/serine/threonine PP2A family protein phosphatase